MAGSANRKKKRNHRIRLLCLFLEIVVVLTLVVIIGWDKGIGEWMESFTSPVVRELDVTGINSSHAVLMRAKGGKVLGEMNARERIYPASLTKMMTAILALEKLDPEDTITLTNEMTAALAGRDATQAGFQPGETVRVIDLIYGAECCIALADTISGTEEQFAELMNQKARRIGMEDTNFRDSTGLHDPDHYSTAYDMALLLKYCMRNDTFREIIESPWHSTPATNVHPDGITFYSTMLKNLPDPYVTGGKILGGKTGFTNDAGLCLASYAEIGEREYILVTAGAPGTTGEPLHVHDAVTIFTRLGEAWQALAG